MKKKRKDALKGYVFFFQAEDGIRDWSVTGVQTCALPILAFSDVPVDWLISKEYARERQKLIDPKKAAKRVDAGIKQIGRASCRERV